MKTYKGFDKDMKCQESNERVFSDRGREGLFLRAFGKRNIR